MRNLIFFMHISLDGFVAGLNGEMDWINLDDAMFDFIATMTDQADTALYGRVTYEMMQSYWPKAGEQPNATKHDIEHSTWYNKVSKVVLSKTIHETGLHNTKVIGDQLSDNINKLKQSRPASGGSESKDILLFGSPTATHALMQQNLIDGYWLFVNPIILGKGIPLFVDIKDKIKLNLLTTRQFTNGVTELNYIVDKQ